MFMAIFYWLLYGLKWKCWRIYNFCCNLFWVYGSIDWTTIVSWKYMKSNKKCVFNVNFQYNHKQVPTAYFNMMFNIHKHISFNFCVGTRVWRVWNLQLKNNFKVDFSSAAIFYWPFSSVIDRNRNWPFNLIQNKVGYRSCFVTKVKLEQFLWNSFYVK
jgi:hypothetical protein